MCIEVLFEGDVADEPHSTYATIEFDPFEDLCLGYIWHSVQELAQTMECIQSYELRSEMRGSGGEILTG